MDKPVEIKKYSPEWAKEYEKEKEKLLNLLDNNIISIEHIGSTSVKGLDAKPILDIMVGVKDLNEVDNYIEPLKSLGYEFVFHQAFPQRRFFRKGAWRAGTHHLHFYKYESENWNNQLLFRNYLQNHPETRIKYGFLKKKLAEQYHFDRPAYTKAKSVFIREVIESAKENSSDK